MFGELFKRILTAVVIIAMSASSIGDAMVATIDDKLPSGEVVANVAETISVEVAEETKNNEIVVQETEAVAPETKVIAPETIESEKVEQETEVIETVKEEVTETAKTIESEKVTEVAGIVETENSTETEKIEMSETETVAETEKPIEQVVEKPTPSVVATETKVEEKKEPTALKVKKELKVGDELYGFKVKSVDDFDERNAKITFLEHKKSGATVALVLNDDIDKAFSFGFNTLVNDDKGIPHVFEHATLGGSKKYPSSTMSFDMMYSTYTTYFNALTGQDITYFPISSLDDAQLYELYKYYFDGVMDPNILRNQKNLDKEAYRYVLRNKDDDIEVTGAVYNEMSANMANKDRVALFNIQKELYKDGCLSVETGGIPSEVIKITHQDLIDFHSKFYSPSNMLMTLYGDIDYEKYLKFADEEYLKNYDKKVVDKKDKDYSKNSKFVEKKYDFPVAKEANVENESVYVYAIRLDDMNEYDRGLFDVVKYAFTLEDSMIKKLINEKLPNAGITVLYDYNMSAPCLMLIFDNVNEKDDVVIKEIVDKSIKDLVDNGIDKDIINMYMNDRSMTKEFARDSHGFMNNMHDIISLYFSSEKRGGKGIIDYYRGTDSVKTEYDNGNLQKLIKKYCATNDNAVFVGTIPRAGLLEKENEEFAKFLKDKKDNMTDKEIEDLIAYNKEYDEWLEEDRNYDKNAIKIANVNDLEEYKAKCNAYEEHYKGVHFISSVIDDAKYNNIAYLFDASAVPYEDLHKFAFMADLFLEMPSNKRNAETIKSEFYKNCYTYSSSVYTNHYFDGGYKPYYMVSVMALDKNLDKIFDLLNEALLDVKFTDINKIRDKASLYAYNIKDSYLSSPDSIARAYMGAMVDKDNLYDLHTFSIDYMNFLENVANMSDEELTKLANDMQNILNNLLNKNGMVCEIVGNASTISSVREKTIAFSRKLRDERIVSVNYEEELKAPAKRLAIVVNGNVQYNALGVNLHDIGAEYSGVCEIFDNYIVAEILMPELRYKNGAYGVHYRTGKDVSILSSYRDPNLAKTYNVYKQLPELLRESGMDDTKVEHYKLSAYATYSYPLTKLECANVAINEILNKCEDKRPERYVRFMQDVKKATKEDIVGCAKQVAGMLKNDSYVTVGGKEEIEKNKNMFDEIIYDLVK